MYNEINKLTYLNILNKETSTYSNVKTIFEAIEYAERSLDTDICDIHPTSYIEILVNSSDKKINFSEFYSKLSLLLRYRIFCQAKGLIEEEKFYANNKSFEYLSNRDCVFKIYNEAYGNKFDINTPAELYRLLKYAYKKELEEIDDAAEVDFVYEELSIIQLQMQYHGITKEEMTVLRISDIKVIDEDIAFLNRKNTITDKQLSKLVEKRLKNKFIIKRNSLLPLSDTFFFGIGNDDSEEKVRKRMMALYHKYMRQRKGSDDNLPTNKEIQFNGIVYQMCMETRNEEINDEFEIARLYKKVTGKQIANNLLRREVVGKYHEMYNYLEKNNWPE